VWGNRGKQDAGMEESWEESGSMGGDASLCWDGGILRRGKVNSLRCLSVGRQGGRCYDGGVLRREKVTEMLECGATGGGDEMLGWRSSEMRGP